MSVPISNMKVTWSDGALHTAIQMNVTDTSSNAASLLMDLQVGGGSKFKIGKDGKISVFADSGVATGTAAIMTSGGNGGGFGLIDSGNSITLDCSVFGQELDIKMGTTGTPLNGVFTIFNNGDFLNTGNQKLQSSQIAANGTVATALTSLGPTSSHTTVQEWFIVKGTGGATRWIPMF